MPFLIQNGRGERIGSLRSPPSRLVPFGSKEVLIKRSPHIHKKKPPEGGFFVNGRGERIRTSGLLLPKQARYQAALRPANLR